MGVFLAKNGWLLAAGESEATIIMLKVAAGALSESELAEWIGSHIEPS